MKRYDETELGKLENKYGTLLFNMALFQLFEMGRENAENITDEDIEESKGNPFMTKKYVQDLFTLVRELSKYNFSNDIIPYIKEFIHVDGCENYKDKSNRMLTIAYNAITFAQLDELYDKDTLITELNCDEDEYDEIMEV